MSRKSQQRVAGSYAEWGRNKEGDIVAKLTDEGRAELARWMDRYPKPVALLRKCKPSLYLQSQRLGISEDEIEASCMAGIVYGFIRYRPGKAKIQTVLGWGVQGSVSDLIRRWKRSSCEHSVSHRWDAPHDSHLWMPEPEARVESEYHDAHGEVCGLLLAANLSPRERTAIQGKLADKKLHEIGNELGVSKERARQLVDSAIGKLKGRNGKSTSVPQLRAMTLAAQVVQLIRRSSRTIAELVVLTESPRYSVIRTLQNLRAKGVLRSVRDRSQPGLVYRYEIARLAGSDETPECWQSGERNHNAKLTAKKVAEIRDRVRAGEMQVSVARDLNINPDVVNKIVRGKAWKGVS